MSEKQTINIPVWAGIAAIVLGGGAAPEWQKNLGERTNKCFADSLAKTRS